MKKEELKKMALDGSAFAKYMMQKDMLKYEKYKLGKMEDSSDYVKIDMKILSLLESLGYPMDMIGSYMYKELIHYIYDKIKDIEKRSDLEKARELIKELEEPFSSIYYQVASEYLEIGIKKFHISIEKMLKKIDSKKIDSSLAIKVYGSKYEPMSYGLQAMLFSGYIAGKYEKSYEKPIVKSLGIKEIM